MKNNDHLINLVYIYSIAIKCALHVKIERCMYSKNKKAKI